MSSLPLTPTSPRTNKVTTRTSLEPAMSRFAPPPISLEGKSNVSSHSGVDAETVKKFNRLLKLFPDRSTELSDLWNKVGAAAQAVSSDISQSWDTPSPSC